MLLSSLSRTSFARIQFGVSSSRIYHGKQIIKRDRQLKTYPFYGMRNNRSGAIFFNRPNYQNKLNMETMQEMYRFLRSYEIDQNIQHIWVENVGNNSFSNGVDYKELLKSPKYLHRVFQLGIMMSKINKPVFGYVKGLVGGTSAYLLNMLSTPFGDKYTHMVLHDIDNHFVPICGGSYLLSRLKGELGAYLALTGDKVDANDMVGTGFIYALVRRDFSQNQLRKKAGELSKIGLRYFPYDTYDFGRDKENGFNENDVAENAEEFMISTQMQKISIMNDPRKDLRVARLAEISYKTLEVGMQNLRKPYDKKNYEHVIDYFSQKQRPVLKQFEQKYIQPHKGEVVRGFPLLTINRVFAYDTIEQIISALKKQGTEWAKNTIQKLESKDALTLKLTLRLIREAKKSTYQQCLEREYRVASKIRLNDSFIKFHSGENVQKKSISDITNEKIENFFKVDNHQHQLLHDIPEYSLLPVKQYRKQFPDPVRFCLNKQFLNDPNSDNQTIQVFRWLRRNGINPHSDSWSLDDLRKRIYLYHNALRKMNDHWTKIDRFFYNHAAQKQFKEVRINYINEIFNQSNVQQLIDKKIKQNFNKKFHSRMQDLKPTSQVFAKQQKGKLYLTLRNILVKKRLTQIVDQDKKQRQLKLVAFDSEGKSSVQDPTILFKGTPLEHIINEDSTNNGITNPHLPSYYEGLNQQVYPVQVNPLTTLKNPELIQVLRRYDEGMFFYSRTDNRQDLALFKKAAEYSQNVKKLLKQYSDQELNDILKKEQRFSWKHLIQESQQIGNIYIGEHLRQVSDLPSFSQLYDLSKQNQALLQKINIEFPKQFQIPQAFKARSDKLLNLISRRILNNFGNWNLKNQVPLFDNWIKQTIAIDAAEYIKNDCHFIFAYFMIKDIEGLATQLGNSFGNERALNQLRQLGIVFENSEDIQSTFHQFILNLIELYNTSVQKIILKNTKLLQLHNRVETNQQIKEKSPQLDKFLIQMGRLRLKLKNRTNPEQTIFNYDTQFNLQTLSQQNFDHDSDLINEKTHLSIIAKVYDTKHKKLISGFESYLERIDKMFKKINSTTDYLPDLLANIDNLEGFEDLTKDIDENQPLNSWLDRKLNEAVEIIFNLRLQAQKNLSVAQLKYLDQQIASYLTPSSLKHIILNIMENDISSLMSFKNEDIKSKDVGFSNRETIAPRRFILNQDAFKRLTNLVNTLHVLQSRSNNDQDLFKQYQQTFSRLIEQIATQKQQTIISQQALQNINFTTSDKLDNMDSSDVNFVKEELKILSSIYNQDEDMIELSKVLG